MKFLLPATLLALLSLPLSARAAGETAWEPAAVVNGAPYHKLDELRSFYKLSASPKSTRKGAIAVGNADVSLELGPGLRQLSICGLQLSLARPLLKDAAGNWLISREDWVSLIDPILRPTYITGREPVRTIVIDPGHGGHDAGTATPQLREAEVALQVARRLKTELEKRGYAVQLTRSEDIFLSDQQRVAAATAAGAGAIFLSLHVNSGRSDFQGASTYTLAPGQDARPGRAHQTAHTALAFALQSALVAQAGTADDGCRHAHYSLLSSVPCPAAWVELGYATHAQEGASLLSPAYQESLAQALAQGISVYAHVANPATHIPTQEPPPAPAKAQGTSQAKAQQPATAPATGKTQGSTSKATPTGKTQSSTSKATSSGKTQGSATKAQTTGKTQSSTSKATSTGKTQGSATKAQTSGKTQSSATKAQTTGKTQSSSSRRQQPPAAGRTRR